MDQPRVFGIGAAKTGSATLGVCLRILNSGLCASWGPKHSLLWDGHELDFDSLLKVSKKYVCYHDFPWNYTDLYKKFDAAYPGSKFILTIRDNDKWFDSFRRWGTRPDGKEDILWRIKKNLSCNGQITKNFKSITKQQYGIDEIGPILKFKTNIIAAYDKRNAEIIEYFKERPESFLEINWERGDGWKELCRFLNVPIPNIPLPHINKNK